nr:energy transducer TonB [Komagataeibacter europaeus]
MPQQQDRTAARLLVPDGARARGRWARMAAGWTVLLAVLGHGVIGAWLLPGGTKVPAAPSEKNAIQVFFDRPEVATPPGPATPQPQPQAAPTRGAEGRQEMPVMRHPPARTPASPPRPPAHATPAHAGTAPPAALPAGRQTDTASVPMASAHAQQAATAARPASTVHCTPPAWRYPPMARHMHEEGSAMVDLVIGGQGQVVQATLRSSSGYDDLDRTAIAAARNVRCTADGGALDGTHLTLPVVFHLKG